MLLWMLKAALLQGLALLIVAGLRRHSAVVRRRVLICCLLAVCALPLLSFVGPGLAADALVPEVLQTSSPLAARPGATAAQRAPLEQTELDGLAANAASQLPWVLTTIWLLGVAALSARWIIGHLRLRRLRREAEPASDGSMHAAVARLTRRQVRLLTSQQIDSPITVGLLRPLIVLPTEADGWAASKTSMAIAHEVAHIRRFDALWINLSLLLRALQWANPLAWGLHRRLRLEMERSADEEVVAGGAPASRYAELLLELAKGARPSDAAELAMARPSGLERRFRSLASMASLRASWAGRWIGVLVIAASFGLGCLRTSPDDADEGTAAKLELADWRGAVSSVAQRLRAGHPGAEVRIGVMRVDSGEVLASVGGLDAPFGSGSTIKPLTLAAALEEGVPAVTVLDCSGNVELGGRVLRDHSPHGRLSLAEALARSSNVAMVRLLERMPAGRLLDWLRRLGVDTAGRASAGDLAGAATGISLNLSITELLTAYGTIANGGISPRTSERVLKPQTAGAVLAMLAGAVNGPAATGRRARVAGTTVAGKTGTTSQREDEASRRTATFVGLVPAQRPRWAVAVAIDGARANAYGGGVAAPAFAEIVRLAAR